MAQIVPLRAAPRTSQRRADASYVSLISHGEAAPLALNAMPARQTNVEPAQYRDLNGDGWVSRREIRRQRGTYRQENRFERRMARRDCYRYGNCRGAYGNRHQDFYGNNWRNPGYRHMTTNGLTLQFHF